MAGANRPARLNRTLLGLIGLLLLAGGVFVLAIGLGLLRPVLPALDPDVPLLPATVALPDWAPVAATAAAVVVGLLCLRWLLAQALRRPRTGTWRLPTTDPGAGTTRFDTAAAAAAIAADIEAYEGVEKAAATLTGLHTRPSLHLVVTTAAGTGIDALRHRITDHALPRLRQALATDTIPTDLLLRIDTRAAARVRAR